MLMHRMWLILEVRPLSPQQDWRGVFLCPLLTQSGHSHNWFCVAANTTKQSLKENTLPRLTHCKADLKKAVVRSQIGHSPNQKNLRVTSKPLAVFLLDPLTNHNLRQIFRLKSRWTLLLWAEQSADKGGLHTVRRWSGTLGRRVAVLPVRHVRWAALWSTLVTKSTRGWGELQLLACCRCWP